MQRTAKVAPASPECCINVARWASNAARLGSSVRRSCDARYLTFCSARLRSVTSNATETSLALIRQRPRFDHDFDEVAARSLVDDGFLQRPSWFRRRTVASAEVVLRHRE